ncbi:MAG TPA: DUF4336 domain-containing protein, partial [Paracoccaceae bacterium]|nr:DUF4336 domain-containing protein [Paracoccaceae bacterium]
ASGGLWLHSPTRFQPALRNALGRIGPVEHLVAPNVGHWTHVRDWRQDFPQATIWAAPILRLRPQVKLAGLAIDHDLDDHPPAAWAAEIDQLILSGTGGYREVVFLHRPSRTLVLTDFVANLEASMLPFATRIFARLNGMLAPDGRAPLYLRSSVLLRRRQAAATARRMLDWAPERVIFAHGRWFETDGTARLARSLRWLTG